MLLFHLFSLASFSPCLVVEERLSGRIGTIFQIFICTTILIAEIVNYAFNPGNDETLDQWKWRVQLAGGTIPGQQQTNRNKFAIHSDDSVLTEFSCSLFMQVYLCLYVVS